MADSACYSICHSVPAVREVLYAAGASYATGEWVIGFGINVNNAPPLKRSTSLRALTGRPASVEAVLKASLARLSRARQRPLDLDPPTKRETGA